MAKVGTTSAIGRVTQEVEVLHEEASGVWYGGEVERIKPGYLRLRPGWEKRAVRRRDEACKLASSIRWPGGLRVTTLYKRQDGTRFNTRRTSDGSTRHRELVALEWDSRVLGVNPLRYAADTGYVHNLSDGHQAIAVYQLGGEFRASTPWGFWKERVGARLQEAEQTGRVPSIRGKLIEAASKECCERDRQLAAWDQETEVPDEENVPLSSISP